MKIHDQKIEFAMQHSAEQIQQRKILTETFNNGQLSARQTEIEENRGRQVSARNITSSDAVWQQQHFSATKTELFAVQNTAETVKNNQASSQKSLPTALLKMIEVVEAMMERLTGKPYHLKVMGYQSAQEANDSREENSFNHFTRSLAQFPVFAGFK